MLSRNRQWFLWATLMSFMTPCAEAKYRRVERKDIKTGEFAAEAPKIRFKTRLENLETEGWLLAATDSSLIIYVKDGGYGASTPTTTGTPGTPDTNPDRKSDGRNATRLSIGAGINAWNAKGIREISNVNLRLLDLDNSATRDLAKLVNAPTTKQTPSGIRPRGSKPN